MKAQDIIVDFACVLIVIIVMAMCLIFLCRILGPRNSNLNITETSVSVSDEAFIYGDNPQNTTEPKVRRLTLKDKTSNVELFQITGNFVLEIISSNQISITMAGENKATIVNIGENTIYAIEDLY